VNKGSWVKRKIIKEGGKRQWTGAPLYLQNVKTQPSGEAKKDKKKGGPTLVIGYKKKKKKNNIEGAPKKIIKKRDVRVLGGTDSTKVKKSRGTKPPERVCRNSQKGKWGRVPFQIKNTQK